MRTGGSTVRAAQSRNRRVGRSRPRARPSQRRAAQVTQQNAARLEPGPARALLLNTGILSEQRDRWANPPLAAQGVPQNPRQYFRRRLRKPSMPEELSSRDCRPKPWSRRHRNRVSWASPPPRGQRSQATRSTRAREALGRRPWVATEESTTCSDGAATVAWKSRPAAGAAAPAASSKITYAYHGGAPGRHEAGRGGPVPGARRRDEADRALLLLCPRGEARTTAEARGRTRMNARL
jgi:hypothetical protein